MSQNTFFESDPGFKSNRLLEALPVASRDMLLTHMDYVSLPVGRVLYRPREAPVYVHFLTSGLASFVTPLASGDEVNVGLVGSEGMVEALHMLGASEVATGALIQVKATALRAPFAMVQKEFQWSDPLRQLVSEQVQEQACLAAQLVACNALHSVDERLARWLLMIADRLLTHELSITQQFLAAMVAARRPTVTVAVGKLQRMGVIRSTRANVDILDRPQLESLACECYSVVQRLRLRSRVPGTHGRADG